jgi:hypothetical protein
VRAYHPALLGAPNPDPTVSRREAMEASQKAAAYRAKHAAGETVSGFGPGS